jgi:hypothetical protein
MGVETLAVPAQKGGSPWNCDRLLFRAVVAVGVEGGRAIRVQEIRIWSDNDGM